MDRALLEKKFPTDQVKQRDGNFGQTLDYLEGHTVVARLNEAFDGEWSFQVIEHQINGDEIIVLASITAEGVTKSQFGSARITRNKETREPVDLGDDFKAATTDAIKKISTLFGIGLYLYNKDQQDSDLAQQTSQGQSKPAAKPINTSSRLTIKQHRYILTLAKSNGMSKAELNEHCRATYSVMFDFVTRTDASSLIENLQNGNVLTGQNNAA